MSPPRVFGEGEGDSDPDDAESASPSVASAVQASASGPVASASWPKLPAWAGMPLDTKAFGDTWPFGLIARGIDFWQERQYLADLSDKSKRFKFGAYQASQDSTPQVVVMVIGESSRYDRWSLNGYERDTNPLLKKESNLVSFPDMITAVSATRLSVPVLVSRKPATQSLQAGFFRKKIVPDGVQGSRLQDVLAVEPDLVRPVRYTGVGIRKGSRRAAIHEPGWLHQ
ncbi:sulfatase-like hydrolase/transferase [Undibacterium arcticum]